MAKPAMRQPRDNADEPLPYSAPRSTICTATILLMQIED